ncbi:prolipoprotein diacylglyceryl transferase, partial [Alkalilimnicola sp. S0819]|uniref:prolipoprotein diacylglyceryl transferase n=1 Tax=Alkalilimnicola sp. S0819 TaxID=2613922 RepID=UPI0013238B8C
MLQYPAIDPVAINLGPLAVHWYGLMYAEGFAAAWWLGRLRARTAHSPVRPAQIDDLLFYLALGAVVGGRLGYILFYDFNNFSANPLMLLRIWEGGMSFHGGLLGVVAAAWLFRRK